MGLEGIKEGLAGAYYSLEDRYYAMLDWLEAKGMPVYKIIDPIDEVFPSFVLFCLIVLFLAMGIIWILFFSQQYYSVNVKVIELGTSKPLAGVSVDYTYSLEGKEDKTSKIVTTGSDGTFTIEKLSGILFFEFSIKKEGFEDFKSPRPVQVGIDSSNVVLSLKKKVILPEGKNIAVNDASVSPSKPINGVNIDVSFSCSSGKTIAAKKFQYSQIDNALTPSESKECGDALATVSVEGFSPTTLQLIATTTTFNLQKQPAPKGSLKAIVKNKETLAALPGITLSLRKIGGTPVRAETSDEAGSFTFNEEPGQYFVKASDASNAFDENSSEIIEIEADKAKETIILMNRTVPSEVKFLKLKVLDSNDSSPVSGAEIYFSENGVINDVPLTTADNGTAEYEGARTGKVYYARVKAVGFVAKFARIFPSERSDGNYNIIRIERANSSNSGNVRVFVNDEENSVIGGADVKLVNSGFESIPIFDITDSTGLADFDSERLPAGDYKAFADKREIDANGMEGPKHLNAGSTLDFNVMIVAGIANIKVKVVNESGMPVSDANVLFFDSNDASGDINAVFSRVSSADGSTGLVDFKVNKHPKIIVSKQGFLPTTVILYTLHRASAQSPMIVQATLYSSNYASDFMINFAFVSKANSFEELPATQQKIYADEEKEYGLVFDLIVPQGQTQNNVKAHVRTDLDRITNEAGARIVVRSASPEKSPVRSADYNSSDAFSDQNVVENALLDAKQVNLAFGSLPAGTYRFYATVKARRVPRDTVLEVHYTAKSDSKRLGDYLKSFKAGASFCRTNCPNFDYLFEVARIIDGVQGEFITANTLPSAPSDLNYDVNYLMRYTVWNTSKNNITQNFNARFSTDDNALVFGSNAVKEYSENFSSQLAPSASIQNSLLLRGVLKTTSTMRLNLNLGIKDDNAGVAFKIMAEDLIVSVPETLSANYSPQDFTIIVADENNSRPVKGALVQVKASAQALTRETFGAADDMKTSDSTGQAAFRLANAFGANYRLFVLASAPGYNETFTSIPFSSQLGLEDGFPCVNFKITSKACAFDANKICLASGDSTSGAFKITTENCPEPVSINLRGGFTAGDGTQVELPLSIASGSLSDIGLLETGESPAIQVSKNPKGILGQFPVFAEITGSLTNFKSTKELVVYSNYPQFSKDCIAIGKTEFDLTTSPTDSNIAQNYCFLQHDDPLVPSVSLESEIAAAAAEPLAQSIASGTQTFKWRVKASVLEAGTASFETSEPGSARFNVNVENLTGSEGFVWTPEAPDAAGIIIDDTVTSQTKIRFLSVHPLNIEGMDQNKAFIKDTKITTQHARDIVKDIPVPCTALGCTWAYSKFEAPCSVLNLAHCTLSYFDIALPAGSLDISRIGALIRNPDNNSFVLLEVFGNVKKISSRTDFNNFTAYSEWRDGTVLAEMQTSSDLGPLNFGTPQIIAVRGPSGKSIVDVNFSIESSNNSVSTWVKGTEQSGSETQVHVFAAYNGIGGLYPISGSPSREIIPFNVYNAGIEGEAYSIFNVNDYIDEAKKRARSQ